MMYKECPIACGVCTPDCKDSKKQCDGWAQAGGCNDNPGFMALHCPVTCGVCEGKCKDTQNDCPGWAAEGECNNNPGHSLVKCPLSCGNCAAGACKDTNATACAVWAIAGQCTETPAYMAKECPATCGICTNVCEDKETDCPNWAQVLWLHPNPNPIESRITPP